MYVCIGSHTSKLVEGNSHCNISTCDEWKGNDVCVPTKRTTNVWFYFREQMKLQRKRTNEIVHDERTSAIFPGHRVGISRLRFKEQEKGKTQWQITTVRNHSNSCDQMNAHKEEKEKDVDDGEEKKKKLNAHFLALLLSRTRHELLEVWQILYSHKLSQINFQRHLSHFDFDREPHCCWLTLAIVNATQICRP